MSGAIEVREPTIDDQALLARLRDKIEARRMQGLWPEPLPDFSLSEPPSVDDSALQYHLEQAHALHEQVWVGLSLAPSAASQVPILGRLWASVRRQAHQLVLYYLEMAISKQLAINKHMVGALNRLAESHQEILALRQDVGRLRQRIEVLEGRAERAQGEYDGKA